MRVLLADETNREPGARAKFFVYGGLILKVDDLSVLDERIASIREATGYQPQDDLKFDTRARPATVDRDAATEAKRQVLTACRDLDAEFIDYVALHDIIKNSDPDDQLLFAANTVISQFNIYLQHVAHDDGICIVDNLPVKASWPRPPASRWAYRRSECEWAGSASARRRLSGRPPFDSRWVRMVLA